MDKFVTRTSRLPQSQEHVRSEGCNANPNIDVNLNNLPTDPGERKQISEYHSHIQDEVRKRYIQIGPIQPKNHEFLFKLIGGKSRSFTPKWFEKHENWLEYSKKKDALFCLPCYLFKPECVRGGEAFVVEGFSSWNKKEKLIQHVGRVKSAHNIAVEKYENLKERKIQVTFHEFSEQDKIDYKTRLETSVICARYLLHMELPFRGHDEYEESSNRGNFIELIKVAGLLSKDLGKVLLKKAPGNLLLISHPIQKDIVNCIAKETLKAIFEELGDDLFALSLRSAIDILFDEFKLSVSSIRGQGYDGASNMRATAKGHVDVVLFFDLVSDVVNVIGSTCKRYDVFRELRAIRIVEAINNGDRDTGRGLNQELAIKRPGDTRWGSHYRSLLNLLECFLNVIDVLEFIYNDVLNSSHKKNARGLIVLLKSFDFVFILHVMVEILGITNELSLALQR
ncbi:uncharacterized protein LOC141607386 [Silene latifolia]|uniref:uncharacterized protein LOC141607386 n=1 Tax=Silene latifolia TaxID=37657 RepID=UPI003D76F39D